MGRQPAPALVAVAPEDMSAPENDQKPVHTSAVAAQEGSADVAEEPGSMPEDQDVATAVEAVGTP
jgi:hypothetical protein